MVALYISFLTSFFSTTHRLLKLAQTVTNFSTPNLSSLLFKFLKLVGTFFNLSTSNFSASGFKLAKSSFYLNFDVLTPAALFKSALIA